MNAFETIIYEKRDGLAFVTLNRPELLNRYNTQMRDELYQVLTAIRDDPEVVAAILKGAGERAFSVGADSQTKCARCIMTLWVHRSTRPGSGGRAWI